jgi:malonyl-CoA O-methyltransferase
MVRRARANLTSSAASVAVMDGETPSLRPASFDLVCASLVFQWFEDLPRSLRGLADLLAPGGALVFSTLTAESFPEWRAAHQDIGVRSAMRNYPTAKEIARMMPDGLRMTLETEAVPRFYRNAHAFLAHWKDIGTYVPDASRPPLTPGTMRKLLRRFDTGITVTYQVAYVSAVKA